MRVSCCPLLSSLRPFTFTDRRTGPLWRDHILLPSHRRIRSLTRSLVGSFTRSLTITVASALLFTQTILHHHFHPRAFTQVILPSLLSLGFVTWFMLTTAFRIGVYDLANTKGSTTIHHVSVSQTRESERWYARVIEQFLWIRRTRNPKACSCRRQS